MQLHDPAVMTDSALESEIRALNAAHDVSRYDWRTHARPTQIEPSEYRTWLIMAGRGFGKTRTGSETLRAWASGRPGQYAVIAKSQREVLGVCFEAPRAGLVAVFPPEEIASFRRQLGMIAVVLKNGSIIRGFSAEAPDSLRGYAFDGVWVDEFSSFSHITAQTTLDMAWFCMREAFNPRMVITTTPKNLTHVKNLVKRAETEPGLIITRGSTFDNAANLSAAALAELQDRYGNSRLGRQEMEGELLLDNDGALFNLGWIESARVDYPPLLVRTVVAVDPASTTSDDSDETGIVVVGTGEDGHDYVLADYSAKIVGAAAAALIWRVFISHSAEEVVLEGANIWMRDVLQDSYDSMADGVVLSTGTAPVVSVSAQAGKRVRAEPVAARYEQLRVHHVGVFGELEKQLCEWTPEDRKSPDRLDALVHAVARLRSRQGHRASIAAPTMQPIYRRLVPYAVARGRLSRPGFAAPVDGFGRPPKWGGTAT